MHLRLVVCALLLGSSMLHIQLASAQVPPHPPGTICFTPQFWCWSPQPAAPGSACSCPSPYGWVAGRLG